MLAHRLSKPKLEERNQRFFQGDRSFSPLETLRMADTRQAHPRSALASSECDDSDVIDLCSVSSGDEDGRSVGSPSVDSDATLSEAIDTDSTVEGC